MEILQTVLLVIIVVTSLLAVLLVLLNKGKGGGLSDMFGGGMTQSLNTSGVAQKNLVRLTTIVAVAWGLAVAAYALTMRFTTPGA
ncbi:preprotein translocase subunit SecG [Kocuria flava]|uniref:Protein-export membrane protein SecG n=1 Tax=Kocuria flava TaxID=446860 RepID=A0A2N4T3U3_9MICC|nr:preprotein translocase subunit SecG [Kocuria flava]PLC12904.1 preprotein translocase subunit SecG [Kocuria flava]